MITNFRSELRRWAGVSLGAVLLVAGSAAPAVADDPAADDASTPVYQAIFAQAEASGTGYNWTRTLRRGHSGSDVKELQIRVAGWVNSTSSTYRTFQLDGAFGDMTELAVRRFQAAYGLQADGVAGPKTQNQLNQLQDADGTIHFSFGEFAARETGGFSDGKVGSTTVKENVRRLMYRLEALRKKQGSNPVKITSGFRTKSRNARVGGASNSQHTYGIAADNQIAARPNRAVRDSARATAFAAIFCYSQDRHNHFDIRANNPDDGLSDTATADPQWSAPASPDTDLVATMVAREESVCRHPSRLSSAVEPSSLRGCGRSRSRRSRKTSGSPSPGCAGGWRRPTSTRGSVKG